MPFPQLRLAIILFSCLLAEAATSSTTPWDQPFSADTSSILKTAAAIPPSKNQKAIVLLDDRKIEFDKAGRQTLTLRMVVRLTGSDAAESPWASVDREYAPWRHHKPELRARVITAKGEVLWLDPKTIAETAARDDGDATIYTDDRIVQAPLPESVTAASSKPKSACANINLSSIAESPSATSIEANSPNKFG